MEQKEPSAKIYSLQRAQNDKARNKALEELKNGSLKDIVKLLKSGHIYISDLRKKEILTEKEIYLLEEIARAYGIIEDQKVKIDGFQRTNNLLNRNLQTQKIENIRLKNEMDIFHPKKKKE